MIDLPDHFTIGKACGICTNVRGWRISRIASDFHCDWRPPVTRSGRL